MKGRGRALSTACCYAHHVGEKISIDKAPEWLDKANASVQAAVQRGLLSAGLRTVSYIVNELIPRERRVPVDRGIYRAGWRATKIPGGVYVHNVAPHANFIEHGVPAENVKPGKAMIDALTEWVKRKGIVKPKGKSAGAKAALDLEARNVAFAIAMSMKQNGIFNKGGGLHILSKAKWKIPEFVRAEVAAEIKRLSL